MHNDCQMDLSPKEQTVRRSTLARWASSTQLLFEKRNGLSLPKLSGTVAALWTWKNQGTCQLVRAGRAVFSLVSRQSVSQNVWLWDKLSNFETYCLILRHTWHKITPKTPVTRLHACSLIFCQEYQWADRPTLRQAVQLWDILSDLELYFTHDHCQDARNKIACKLTHVLSRQSVSQNVWLWDKAVRLRDILSDLETYSTQDYCQDARNKIACRLSHLLSKILVSKSSNFETGCPTSRHTVWSWDILHTRSLPRRP